MVDPDGENISFTTHTVGLTTNTSLIISDAKISYTGYYWIETSSYFIVCNASLSVLTGSYICGYLNL